MLQVKIVQEFEVADLNKSINDFLATIKSEDVRGDIKVDMSQMIAIIEYEVKEAFANRKCYDCKYWDDGGSTSAVSGLCHECGQRRRFNCDACSMFKDARG